MSDREIGKFTAPGSVDCAVLSMEITRDAGLSRGIVRLDRRPYWEGSATPVRIEMRERPNCVAMNLTALMVGRSIFDGGGCDVDLDQIELEPIAFSGLDEPTQGEEIEWGELRSLCARKDWRGAWELLGTDHVGDATPGEVYLFGVARETRAVSAALRHWYLEAALWSGYGQRHITLKARFKRIKSIARWESSAAAQFDAKHKARVFARALSADMAAKGVESYNLRSMGVTINGRPIETFALRVGEEIDTVIRGWPEQPPATHFGESSRFTREAFDRMADTLRAGELRIPDSVRDDLRAALDDLLTKGALAANPLPRGPEQRKRRSR